MYLSDLDPLQPFLSCCLFCHNLSHSFTFFFSLFGVVFCSFMTQSTIGSEKERGLHKKAWEDPNPYLSHAEINLFELIEIFLEVYTFVNKCFSECIRPKIYRYSTLIVRLSLISIHFSLSFFNFLIYLFYTIY